MKLTVRILSFIFPALCFAWTASGQTILDSLRPQPRQAYERFLSSVFVPSSGHMIYLDPANPAWLAASELNVGLREKGKDTIAVKLWEDSDSLQSGVCLGVRPQFINEILLKMFDQRLQVTETYPGPEGYIIDVLAWRVLISGSDEAGLHYGVNTLLQLLFPSPNWWGLEPCRIIDAPEFPKRWFYYSTNIQVGGNITKAKSIWDQAARWRLNGVNLNDSKFSRPTTLPNFYFDSLLSLKKYAEDRRLKIIPGVMPFGYSNSLLFHDPNLTSGLPVRVQQFVIENDTARLAPRRTVNMTNPGFEKYNGNNFPGYRFIDKPGQMSFVDTLVAHSGKASARFENFSQYDPQYGNGRVSFWTKVTPFTLYHVSGWVRTENLSPAGCPNISVLNVESKSLAYNQFNVPSTTGWRKLDFTFNSLDADSIGVYWGVWGAKDGKIWWDDLVIEEVPFINLIRRVGAPLTVAHPILGIVYAEGVDFDTLRDPLMGTIPYAGVYTLYHTPPTFRIRPGGLLKNGDTILVSYYHMICINGVQVMITMSDSKVYEIVEREFAVLDSLLKPDTYFMQHDEIRAMNWDYGDQARGLTPSQILVDNVEKCLGVIRRYSPNADVWIWTDMFDEFHNAVAKNYYFVNGDLTGSADAIPKTLGMANWNSREGIVQKSLDFFASKNFRQISAPYYDNDENHIRRWKEWTRETPDFQGMMYTTWQAKYTHLEPFGEYAWNHAPYIYHKPAFYFSPTVNPIISLRIIGDRWDNEWKLTGTNVYFRTMPGEPFTEMPVIITPGMYEDVQLPLSPGAQWVQWYVTATDNRGWTTRSPFADTMFYELGEIPTSIDNPGNPTDLHLHGCYPNPIVGHEKAIIEWSSKRTGDVTILINDLYGREVARFRNDQSAPGFQRIVLNLSNIPNGVFFYRIASADGVTPAKKLVVFK